MSTITYKTHRPDLDAPIEAAQLLGLGATPPPAPPVVTRRITLEEPKTAEMAANFAKAMSAWVAAGLPVVSETQYAARSAACNACPYWDGAARFGLGKCNAPGCGCTVLKRWLATERCKHPEGSRWPAIAESGAHTS